ncbi:manganese catalase family protein [Mucilaginibacter sp. E4BP6]
MLEQFGGENGELAAAMQYFTQAFGAKVPHLLFNVSVVPLIFL